MRKVYCIALMSFFVGTALAQNVAVIDGKPISKKEFIWFYKKNHRGGSDADYQQLENYLNQYINFKLKVLDAKNQGLDKDMAYLNEIKAFEKSVQAQNSKQVTKAEYAHVLNEYKEAVLMFNISEIKLWNKAQNDEDQQKLEEEWVSELRKNHNIKVNKEEIRKLSKP